MADAFRSVVLLAAVARSGSREAGFEYLGMGAQVKNRNHQRTLKREGDRLKALADALDEAISEDLTRAL